MIDALPVLGICGSSGAGKTTLIEQIVPRLVEKGLRVAIVKHDVHGINVDHPGKDSDRMFRAGADVLLQGPTEEFFRAHGTGDHKLVTVLRRLSREYDLILLEGHKETPVPKIWLLSDEEGGPPAETKGIMSVLPRDAGRVDAVLSILESWLSEQWLRTNVFGCVLIGGKNTRMGRPKHLLKRTGRTWLEQTVELLQKVTQRVVVVGDGEVPAALNNVPRLPDAPDAAGPMAGILSAMRWAAQVSWIVAACDLPDLSLGALRWLLATRGPGVWATLPKLAGAPGLEPLLAHYDFRSGSLLEELAAEGDLCPAHIVNSPKVISLSPPRDLAAAWRNVNTEEELGVSGLSDAVRPVRPRRE